MELALAALRVLLAAVFILAGCAKLADGEGFRNAVSDFGVPPKLARAVGAALPAIEVGTAVGLLFRVTARWAATGAILLLAAFMIAITVNLLRGRRPECRCFGQLRSSPVSWFTLIRNAALAIMAGLIIIGGPGSSVIGWAAGVTNLERALLLTVGMLVLAVGFGIWLVVNLVKQYGGMLLRVERVERELAAAPRLDPRGANRPSPSTSRTGLPVGAKAPDFTLAGLNGETLTLARLRSNGLPVLLLFMDSACGPCNSLLPQIATWQRELANTLTIGLICSGDEQANRTKAVKHSLTNVLLAGGDEVARRYLYVGTPSALIVTADGAIATHLAAGVDAIRSLVTQGRDGQNAFGELSAIPAHQNNANGSRSTGTTPLPVGTLAPTFTLSDAHDAEVRLEDYRGREALVVFWNPSCGFCQRLLPDLEGWERDQNEATSPQLLIVSTGSAAQNGELSLRSPVLQDSKSSVMARFGVSGTPIAILIDADGRISSSPLVGGSAVMAALQARTPKA